MLSRSTSTGSLPPQRTRTLEMPGGTQAPEDHHLAERFGGQPTPAAPRPKVQPMSPSSLHAYDAWLHEDEEAGELAA